MNQLKKENFMVMLAMFGSGIALALLVYKFAEPIELFIESLLAVLH